MVSVIPLQHLKFAPQDPRLIDYNPSACERIRRKSRQFNRNQLDRPGHPYRGPRFGKKWYMRMDQIREEAPPQYEPDDRRIVQRMVTLIDNDVNPDSTGSAGAVHELSIQKEQSVTGQRVKWGILSSAGLIGLQTLGFL